MRTKFNFLISVVFLITIISCDDVFEEDISDKVIQIIYPTNNSVISGNTVEFSWQLIDGADNYRIQIINDSQQTIVDSLVSNNYYVANLQANNYSWRVRGENFAYDTSYTFPENFTVINSDDLTNQQVILETPSNNYYTNTDNVILSWQPLIASDNYDIEVVKNINGEVIILQNQGLTNTNYTLTNSVISEDAEYIWKIRANNSSSSTVYSERSLFIDRVAPSTPNLNSPNENEIFSNTQINFSWSISTNTGQIQSVISYIIEISSDINFSTIIESSTANSNSYSTTLNSNTTYYWRIQALDLAGNISNYSNVRTFTIQ